MGDRQFRFHIDTANARQMHEAWPRVSVGSGYFDAGSQFACSVLFWQGNIFPSTIGCSLCSGVRLGGGEYQVGGGVTAPVPLNSVEAEFSVEARQAKLQGVCPVSSIVNALGLPENPRVVRALGKGLDEKVLDAVRQYRFKPAMKDGNLPVPVMITVEVNFHLY